VGPWSLVEEKRSELSYEDTARSHVKELAREAFRLDHVVVDGDGNLPFPCGTAMFYVSVVRDGQLVQVWSQAVAGIKVNKAVLREINEVNAGLAVSRVYATDTRVIVEGCLPVETPRARDLGALCFEVGTTADKLGSLLAAAHRGHIMSPEGCDAGFERED
jgi:hypothetical protein